MAESGLTDIPKKPKGRYRTAFFTGLATLLPTVLTIFIVTFCYNFLKQNIADPLNAAMREALKSPWAREYYWGRLWNKPPELLDGRVDPGIPGDMLFTDLVQSHVPNWIGFVIGLILVFAVGFIFKGYVGRQTIRMLESWILRVPLVKVIYPYAKQVTEFFFKEKKNIEYQTCVSVEYPRKGIWSIGFVTSDGFRQISEAAGTEVVSIFVPSSPTPFTGYTIMVPRNMVIPLDMTVDEALRFSISGGVILPPSQVPPLALKTRKIAPFDRESGEGSAPADGESRPQGS